MLEDKKAPGRGRAGHHHGIYRNSGTELTAPHPIRLILVSVDDSGGGRARLDIAAHLARATESELVGIGIVPANAPKYIMQQPQDGDASSKRSPAHSIFAAKMANAGIEHYWREVHSANTDDIVAWAKLADLSVLGQLCEDTPAPFRADRIGLESGRPTLVLPPKLAKETVGSNVVIAWDGSREVVRALYDAMPLMRDAARISLVECVEGAQSDHNPNAQAARLILERHGFQAFSNVESVPADCVTDLLLEYVRGHGADLLVAGLYHHSRLREYIFGGVSRELLQRCPVPLLVSH